MPTITVHTARKARPCGHPNTKGGHNIQPGYQYLRHVAFPGDEGHDEGTQPWVIEQCLTCAGQPLEGVRSRYNVPAAVGMRVTAAGTPGRIVGSDGLYVLVLLDGNRRPDRYHPHELQYPVESGEQQTAPEMWLDLGPYGAGWVCGEPDPDRPDGVCGMPVEDEPCPIHHPA